MAERYDLPKIKPEGQPSIFNHDMGKWGVISGVVAGTAIGIANFKNTTINKSTLYMGLAAEIAGAALGGVIGKNKQEREMTEGRVVKTPGYWNKGILSGWMASSVIQLPWTMQMLKEHSIGVKSSATKVWAGSMVTLGSMAIGSMMRKNDLQRDFDRAVEVRDLETQALQNQLRAAQIANNTPPVSYKNSVDAHEAAVLAEKHAHKESHAEKAQHAASETELAEAAR